MSKTCRSFGCVKGISVDSYNRLHALRISFVYFAVAFVILEPLKAGQVVCDINLGVSTFPPDVFAALFVSGRS